eukprot:CAMPEP_0168362502 /NCGR_PEP_ID=MMETSP0228-20121227/3211_1 /TAXON_ID=133427 /ORGANISM="Protoceratium reticulatum, Strain CCCM 535 (=CCMP 1889)" /LENGTH=1637 /DNA_ID=CAMNT_0008375205 /DNA_START=24 /DNA_END=4937 /DNA_ORIENTATION=+
MRRAYLLLYNAACACGWSFCVARSLSLVGTGRAYDEVGVVLAVVQTAMLLEIAHAILGLVPSPVITVAIQVMSRIFILWGHLLWVPACQQHWSFLVLVSSWGVTEVVRYLFYFFGILGSVPYPLFYLRYSLFMVLYPTGITSEVIQVLIGMASHWSAACPIWFRISAVVLVLYVPGSPGMIGNMWANRRRSFKRRRAAASEPQGVVWPRTAQGDRSTTATNRSVLAAAARAGPGGQGAFERIQAERNWRFQYARHMAEHVQQALASPEACLDMARAGLASAQALLRFRRGDSEVPLAQAVAQLRGAAWGLDQLAARFLALLAAGDLEQQAGSSLARELETLRGILASSPLGDPLASAVPQLPSQDEVVQAHGEATVALLSAQLASKEWDRMRLSRGKEATPESRASLMGVVVEMASLRMRMADYSGAHLDLKQALETGPITPEAVKLARDCSVKIAEQSNGVLNESATAWAVYGSALKSLRERLKDVGYMQARSRWTYPPRLPPVRNMASNPEAWNGGHDPRSEMDMALKSRSGTVPFVTKPSQEDGRPPATRLDPSILPFVLAQEQHAHDLVDLIRLFMLHRSLKLDRAKALLGPDVCVMLLKCRALTCCHPEMGHPLEPPAAMALVHGAAAGAADAPDVFASVLLWPVDDELLVAFDFEQSRRFDGQEEPVPYLAQDSHALMCAAPRSPQVQSVLDLCCGCGAQGLVALRSYARHATFVDSNPRSLRFARFNAYLNGVGEQCSFIEGSLGNPSLAGGLGSSKFDAILACPGHLPNPRVAIATGSPCFARGGPDGEAELSTVIAKGVQQLLRPGGRLTAVTMAPNAGSLAQRLVGWADAPSQPADVRAVVFRGEPLRDEDCVHLACQGCPPASAAAHLGGMRRAGLRSLSQAVVLLRAAPEGSSVPDHAARVETAPQHPGLWSDGRYLESEVQAALDGLAAMAALDAQADPSAGLYELDWAKGKQSQGGPTVPLAGACAGGGWPALQGRTSAKGEFSITLDRTAGSNLGAQVNPSDGKALLIESVLGGLLKDWNAANPRDQVCKGDSIVEVNGIRGSSVQLLEECKQRKILQVRLRREAAEKGPPQLSSAQKGEFVPDASRWKDVAMHRLLGWSPPALCDWRWHKTALPLGTKQRGTPPTGFSMAIVELRGCRCPPEFREALRSLNCSDRYAFEGEPRALRPLDGRAVEDMTALLNRYDVLVLPLETGGGRVRPLHELPVEALYFIEAVCRHVYSTKRPLRLVMVTCGCSGPSYAGATDDGFGLPAAVPLRGLFRCSRIENLQVPILHLDSDALLEPGRGKELAAQVDCELELSTPEVGFYRADVAEQNRAIIHTHREVAYRGGARFLPKLDLCARNPIFPGARIGPLPGPAARGVALITGGTGGHTAEALVELGVPVVVLSSRSGRISRGYQGLEQRLDALRMTGARVELEACDASDEKQAAALLERIRRNYGPPRWIMNAAGIVLPQDPSLMQQVFEPKCLGAWYMHKHSLSDNISTFMVYSSMSAGAGANDLGNYAAANTYIDELARLRQSMGLAAVSIMFPEVEEAGMAADMIGQGGVANIPAGNVKQTVKQVVCGTGPMAPCVAIVPQGYLIPRTPTMDSILDPLKARVNKDLWQELLRNEEKSGKDGRGR